ncbi:MAG: formylglycine-generating enzyme family protein [Deferribacteres bacterium]|nr:formylglycine-generating enzyme family protein [candidate division KSB1 bacterium]MCA9740926.1 formylglycine-generating enzyme family protein [candidate division KSB1 bacterium]MCB9510469.1 formylglycine-generating enzyme family protein [Deferribacteres bacterium]
MGKTAFMVNLYMAFHSILNFRRKQKQNMKLFRFQPPDIENPVDIIDRIKDIKDDEAKNTILLLDGLDEDPFILSKDPAVSDDDAFVDRLNKIASNTIRFCDVVITCRTQYFPQEELQDYVLNIRKPGGGFYKLNKYYIFPFSDKEVGKYLRKKYGFMRIWNRSKKEKAKNLVRNSHKLMSRPMLLSYLDDLVLEENGYAFSYQIYETLIEKWLIRESEKWRIDNEQERFRTNLRKLSRETALQIYQNWQSKGVLYLAKDDAFKIAETHHIDLKPDEVKGKSLLTCDPLLNWKFAHKSILEYFLALECVENWSYAIDFSFNGMDMAEHFYKEMVPEFNASNFVKLAGGTFDMGDESSDLSEASRPVHQVTLSDFYIAKTPVTQKQWHDVMGSNPSHFKGCDDCPVESVSWHDAQSFIERLSTKTGMKFRLPTEAEWEYAARGGNKSKVFQYSGSDNLDEVGWFAENSGDRTHAVGEKKPNELGIYDMSGNVWEWCLDWYDEEYYQDCKKKGVVENPTGPETGSRRVLRGGGWSSDAQNCRPADRFGVDPGLRGSGLGFRLVFVP